MIKLKKILNIFHDPFNGKLYEGLIQSVDIDTATKHLKTANYEIDSFNKNEKSIVIKILPRYASELLQRVTSGYIYDDSMHNLFKLINNLGYEPAYIKYYTYYSKLIGVEYSNKEMRRIYDNERPNIIFLTINKKFDDIIELKDLPENIYHITRDVVIDKIKLQGFKPSSKNKMKSHPDRIYFSLSIEGIKTLSNHEKFNEYDTLITVDTKKIKPDTAFFKDPDYKEYSVYTYDNISKECIVNIEKINK